MVTAHLGQPCITDTECLLCDLTSAAALDMASLWQSSPDLALTLERRAAEIQDTVEVSQAYWLEMAGLLAAQRQAQPTHLHIMHTSQCMHRRRRRLVMRGWQPHAYDPDTKLACTGLVCRVVSHDCCALFTDITVGPASVGVTERSARCPSSPSSRKRASWEAVQREVRAPHAHTHRQPSPPPSREDFNNHASSHSVSHSSMKFFAV